MAFAVHKLHFCFAGCINYISPPLLVSLAGSTQQSAQCGFQAGGECGDKTNGGRVTDPEILIKSSGNAGALLPFEENRVLFWCQRLDSMPSLCFLVSREISGSDLCESKVRERALLFVSLATFVSNFRGRLHSLQASPPLNCGQTLAAARWDIAVSPL